MKISEEELKELEELRKRIEKLKEIANAYNLLLAQYKAERKQILKDLKACEKKYAPKKKEKKKK